MNKGILIGVVLVILLGLGGAYFLLSRSSSVPSSPENQTESSQTTSAPAAKKSLKDLMALGQSQQCGFTDPTGNSGTMYVSGGKSRGDFTSDAGGTAVQSHMIYDGQSLYIWMDGQTQGYKSTLDTATPTGSPSTPGTMDANQAFDYDCSSWVTDASLFTPPTGIEFLDASAMMAPKVTTAPGTSPAAGSSDQCAACESLTGSSRTQCLAALNCQ